ncbi:MAG: sugar phosphate isomerase/epimerase family protein, partial [Planctomycetota bacterium]
EEILEVSDLKLASMNQTADFLNRETAEIEVERVANTARFLSANKSMVLVVSPTNLDTEELHGDDWTTFAAVLEEMGCRCDEFGVTLAYRPRAGFVGGSDRDIKRVLGMVDEKVVNLCFDTAEVTLAGINPDRFFKNSDVEPSMSRRSAPSCRSMHTLGGPLPRPSGRTERRWIPRRRPSATSTARVGCFSSVTRGYLYRAGRTPLCGYGRHQGNTGRRNPSIRKSPCPS